MLIFTLKTYSGFILILSIIGSSESLCKHGRDYEETYIYHCSCNQTNCKLYDNCCTPDMAKKPKYPFSALEPPTCVLRYDIADTNFVYMWTKCTNDYPKFSLYRQLCEESNSRLLSYIPVYTNDGLLFKNVFCGLCNNIKRSELKFPEVNSKPGQFKLTCEKQQPISLPKTKSEILSLLSDKGKHCHLLLFIPSIATKKCHQNVVSACSINNHPKQSECEQSGNIWYTLCKNDNKIYANKACAECNSRNCTEAKFNNPYSEIHPMDGHSFSYDILFNMDIPKERVNETSTADKVSNTIHTIFSILSIISLFVLVLVYVLIAELRRNVHGICIIGLALCLGLGMLAFFIAIRIEDNGVFCQAMAAIVHYLYLCSFLLMSLNAFDLLRIFLSKSITQHSMTKHKIVIYAMIAFVTPLIITLTAIIVDKLAPNSIVAPKYGAVYCWLSNPYGLLTWFYVPVSMSVLFNMIACLMLIRFFYRAYRQESQTIKTKRQLVFICLKVTIILGFAWGLMLISTFVNNTIYKDIASYINSLQGVFISICFLSNKKTLTLVQSSVSSVFSTRSSSSGVPRRGSAMSSTKYTRGSSSRKSRAQSSTNSQQTKL